MADTPASDREAHASQPPLDVRAARKVAHVMDDCYLDPILGLVPGVGDAIGGMVGFGIIVLAWRRGVHRLTLARMLLNVGLDSALGSIPILGDVADFFFRSNTLNARLLERATTRPPQRFVDGLILAVAVVLCLAVLVAPVVFIVWLLWTAWSHGY